MLPVSSPVSSSVSSADRLERESRVVRGEATPRAKAGSGSEGQRRRKRKQGRGKASPDASAEVDSFVRSAGPDQA